MGDWKALLKTDPTPWLLEEQDPSARHFALRDLLDLPEDDPEVLRAREAIMREGRVPEILALQREPAYLKTHARFYADKYRGLVWQLMLLSDLGARQNEQIRDQCEYLLCHSQETGDGGFAVNAAARTGGGRLSEVIPCLTGNLVWSLIHFGYLEDARLQKAIGWLTRFMRFNDGAEDDPQVPPYSRYEMCWGRHTCFMGAVKALKGLAAIPPARRSPETERTIQKAAEFLLRHHIHRRSHDLSRVSRPGWLRLSFPLMYQTDLLEILDILTGLHIKDPRMDEALQILLSKQDDSGKWKMENSYIGDRLLVPIGQKGQPDKQITLRAMRVLKRRYGEE